MTDHATLAAVSLVLSW